MRLFWTLFRGEWQILAEYRMDLVLYSLASAVVPFMGLAMWLAVASNNSQLVYSNSEIITYFLAAALVNNFTSAWSSWFINEEIIDGGFSKYLVKPYSMLSYELAENVAEKVIKFSIILLPVVVLWYLLIPAGFTLNLGLGTVFLCLVSLISAFFINLLLSIAAGLSGFWVSDIGFINSIQLIFEELLSGSFIPIAFLPSWLHQLSVYLPFRYTLSFPIEIFLGKVQGYDLYLGLLIQMLWLLVAIILYKSLFGLGSKGYQGYGG